ncbi:MAG: hypothetical protein KZQ62_05570 [Candidatus Thiodiazotropha sp. (ex Lucinoma aequizonata)]|nr:hypothetical protein [Candidatus Thiodiazotropha sp. (ex Lucinoma aequizonata)]
MLVSNDIKAHKKTNQLKSCHDTAFVIGYLTQFAEFPYITAVTTAHYLAKKAPAIHQGAFFNYLKRSLCDIFRGSKSKLRQL